MAHVVARLREPERLLIPSKIRPIEWACLLALVALVLLLFLPVVFMDEGFYFRDLTFNHLGRKHVATEQLTGGTFPLWNPYLNMGEPLLANPNNAAVHPSNLLFLVLPFWKAFNWALLLEWMLAAVSMYLLQRRWQVRPLAAFVAASGYLLSGHLLSLGNFWNALAAAAPAPLALLAADIAARSKSNLGPLFLGGVLALQATGGEPVIGLLTAALAAAYLLLLAEGETPAHRFRHAATAIVKAAAWAFGLAAIQILPAIDFVRETPRIGGLSVAEGIAWSVHPATLLETLVPGLYGNPTLASPHFWGAGYLHRGMPYILSLGIGKVSLVLAIVAGLLPTRRNLVLLGAAGLALLFALGSHTPLFPLAFEHLPFFSLFRFPVKFFFITNLCLCALAGPALERVIEGWRWTQPQKVAAWTFAVIAALGLLAGKFVADPPTPAATVGPLLIAALCILAALALLRLLSGGSEKLAWLLLALAALQIFELHAAHADLNPSAPRGVLTERGEIVRQLQQDPDLFRIHRRPPPKQLHLPAETLETPLGRNLIDRKVLTPNYGLYFGLAYALNRTSDALEQPATALLGSFAESLPPDRRRRILGLANIKYIVDFDRLSINRDVMPRAYVVGEARRVDELSEACIAMGQADFDPRRTVILSGSAPPKAGGAGFSPATVVSYEANRVLLDVRLEAPGILVLLDSFAPGWTATVDATPVPIERANVAFRAVAVGSGEHRIEFLYRPRSVVFGAWITGLALLAALVQLVYRLRRPAVVSRPRA